MFGLFQKNCQTKVKKERQCKSGDKGPSVCWTLMYQHFKFEVF